MISIYTTHLTTPTVLRSSTLVQCSCLQDSFRSDLFWTFGAARALRNQPLRPEDFRPSESEAVPARPSNWSVLFTLPG